MSRRAWVYGDDVNTDLLAPGYCLKLPIEEMAPHCLEAHDPNFAGNVRTGDVFVAGENLGLGSSREYAAAVLKYLGIRVILAKSFARIFYRNALNVGVPALFFPQAAEIKIGDDLDVDLIHGTIRNKTSGKNYSVKVIPPRLMEIIDSGGLIPHLEKQFARGK